MQEPDNNKEFTPGQYVRVRSDEDEPWEDVRIYVQKQGGLHYVTKAGEVRHTDGDATEGFLYVEKWVPEVGDLVLWKHKRGYCAAIVTDNMQKNYTSIKLMFEIPQTTTTFRYVPFDGLIPYYLPPFKPASHE